MINRLHLNSIEREQRDLRDSQMLSAKVIAIGLAFTLMGMIFAVQFPG